MSSGGPEAGTLVRGTPQLFFANGDSVTCAVEFRAVAAEASCEPPRHGCLR